MTNSNRLAEALKEVGTKPGTYKLIAEDLLDLLCWSHNRGGYRVAMFPEGMDDIVIKVEFNDFGRQNIMEQEAWHYLKNHKREEEKAKFFCPVYSISKNGKILVQKRVTKAAEPRDFFKEELQNIMVPASFLVDDPHVSNFGWIDKQFVCIDYGFVDTLAYIRDDMVPFEKFKNHVLSAVDDSEKEHKVSDCTNYSTCYQYLDKRRDNGTN